MTPRKLSDAQREYLFGLADAEDGHGEPPTGFYARGLPRLINDSLVEVSFGGLIAITDVGRAWVDRSRLHQAHAVMVPTWDRASNPDKWAYAQSLRDAGHTLEVIGAALGVTRERVRQKTTVAREYSRAATVDPLALIRTIRASGVASLGDLTAATGHNASTITECLRQLGMDVAIMRLLRWRRTFPTRQRHAAIIRAEFNRLGRTPTMYELAAAMGTGPTAAAPILRNCFGSIKRAMEYAGVPHRSVHAKWSEKFVTQRPHFAGSPRKEQSTCAICGREKKRQGAAKQWKCPDQHKHRTLTRAVA